MQRPSRRIRRLSSQPTGAHTRHDWRNQAASSPCTGWQHRTVSRPGLRFFLSYERISAADLNVKQRSVTTIWMSAAFGTAFGLAAITLAISGTGTTGLTRALRVTARFSFLLFWLGYTGGALKTLFGPSFQPIAWRGRDFGLAFAAAHLVHIGLV